MMGTQRSSAELPRWIGDTQSASFTAPLLCPLSERTESEDGECDADSQQVRGMKVSIHVSII